MHSHHHMIKMVQCIRLNSEKHIHYFEPNIDPAIRVEANARIILQTMDALEGRAFNPPGEFSPEDVNPATGPIFIEGAKPGDVLAVKVLAIRPAGAGYAGVGSGAHRIMRQFHVGSNGIRFSEGISLEAHPMIGVIGVAPRVGRYSNTTAGDHGGNMDCNLIRAGSTIYLPIFVEGGLIAIGDVHAAMGDGEVGGQGIEVAAEVEIEVGTMQNWALRRPFIETDEVWATVAAARDLVKAAWVAVGDMADYVSRKFGFSDAEALLLLSAAGDVRVCQIVTEMPTARFELSKRILRNL